MRAWFYYGNNPISSRLPFLSFHIELEMWALWILSQEWKKALAPLQVVAWAPATLFYDWKSSNGFSLGTITAALEELAGKELVAVQKPKRSPLSNQRG
jgi:hypothetical protein